MKLHRALVFDGHTARKDPASWEWNEFGNGKCALKVSLETHPISTRQKEEDLEQNQIFSYTGHLKRFLPAKNIQSFSCKNAIQKKSADAFS